MGSSYGQSFTARYGGDCADCRKAIEAGQTVRYRYPGKRLCHADCSEAPEEAPAPYRIGGGSGYGCRGWKAGDVVRASDRQRTEQGYPEYLYVVRAKRQYVSEDGLSFGVGDESGYYYSATCREATEEESAPLRARIDEKERKAQARRNMTALVEEVQKVGERPDGSNVLDGERLLDTQNIYGGGDWWVIEEEHIWYVRNNGADGDCWEHNNVQTGGAGAIGWRVERTAELEERLRSLAEEL